MGAFDERPPITLPDPLNAEAFRKKWGWDEHEMIMLKGTITVADQEYVSNNYVISDKKGNLETKAGNGRYALLDRMIVDWTLLQPNGHKAPVTAATIRRLPANYSNPILETLDKLAADMTDDEQENFLDSANGRIEVSSNLVSLPLTKS